MQRDPRRPRFPRPYVAMLLVLTSSDLGWAARRNGSNRQNGSNRRPAAGAPEGAADPDFRDRHNLRLGRKATLKVSGEGPERRLVRARVGNLSVTFTEPKAIEAGQHVLEAIDKRKPKLAERFLSFAVLFQHKMPVQSFVDEHGGQQSGAAPGGAEQEAAKSSVFEHLMPFFWQRPEQAPRNLQHDFADAALTQIARDLSEGSAAGAWMDALLLGWRRGRFDDGGKARGLLLPTLKSEQVRDGLIYAGRAMQTLVDGARLAVNRSRPANTALDEHYRDFETRDRDVLAKEMLAFILHETGRWEETSDETYTPDWQRFLVQIKDLRGQALKLQQQLDDRNAKAASRPRSRQLDPLGSGDANLRDQFRRGIGPYGDGRKPREDERLTALRSEAGEPHYLAQRALVERWRPTAQATPDEATQVALSEMILTRGALDIDGQNFRQAWETCLALSQGIARYQHDGTALQVALDAVPEQLRQDARDYALRAVRNAVRAGLTLLPNPNAKQKKTKRNGATRAPDENIGSQFEAQPEDTAATIALLVSHWALEVTADAHEAATGGGPWSGPAAADLARLNGEAQALEDRAGQAQAAAADTILELRELLDSTE